MTWYKYDDYGWYIGELEAGSTDTSRATELAPQSLSTDAEVGQLHSWLPSLNVLTMWLTTLSQSRGLCCRNKCTVGYQGESLRSSSQRKSGANGSMIQVGQPSAADR